MIEVLKVVQLTDTRDDSEWARFYRKDGSSIPGSFKLTPELKAGMFPNDRLEVFILARIHPDKRIDYIKHVPPKNW